MNGDPEHPLDKGLAARLRAWRGGLLRAAILRVLAVAAGVLVAIAVIDLILPLDGLVRMGLMGCLLLGVAVAVVWAWLRNKRLNLHDMARLSDGLRRDPRQSLQGAFEIRKAQSDDFLINRTVDEAEKALERLPVADCKPKTLLKRALVAFAIVCGIAAILAIIEPAATVTLLGRLVAPTADIPPYSRLEFTFPAEPASVVYGDDLEVRATIDGAPIKGPVYLLTRYEGTTEKVECFRGNNNEYSQRIEKLTRPIEYAFAAGKTRSRWQPIELLLEPRFALTRFIVTPPAYTRREASEVILGTQKVEGPMGSQAELIVTSNRPLSRGEATIEPVTGGTPVRIEAAVAGPHSLKFRWSMDESAAIAVNIWDLRGTPCPEPLSLAQSVLPDEPPTVNISEPAMFSQATPNGKVPLTVEAEDDHGLRRVALMRSMPGLRSRALEIGPDAGSDQAQIWKTALDLGRLGVKPGDILQLQGEGRDHNPTMTGIATSTPVTIQIISESEYRRKLQERVTVDEFAKRYAKASESLERLEESLKKVAEMDDSEPEADVAKAVGEASAAAKQTSELYSLLSNDMALYDIEEAINKELSEVGQLAAQIGQEMAAAPPSQANQTAKELLERLNTTSQQLERQFTDVGNFEKTARVMEVAAEFARLVQQQDSIAADFNRSRQPGAPDLELLALSKANQELIRQQLGEFPERLRQALSELPTGEQNDKLRSDATEFLERLETLNADHPMGEAVGAASNQDAGQAENFARNAHELLNSMLPQPGDGMDNSFANMCQGLFPAGGSMGASLQQCLAAIHAQKGWGLGRGLGGGSGEDGYAVQEFDPFAVPVFGPQRFRFAETSSMGATGSQARSTGSGNGSEGSNFDRTEAGQPTASKANSSTTFIQNIPEKYREAVRRYFSNP